MRIRSFEFSLRELAGSMGDFGTLFPLVIGYVAVCGMDPVGLLVMLGLTNIATGLIYRLPMPLQPMKVLAVVAIAHRWAPEKIYTSALVMGVVWLLMGATAAMTYVARWTPKTVVRGIQLSLGALLAKEGLRLLDTSWTLGLLAIVIVLLLRKNRYAPAAIVLVALGIVIIAINGQLTGLTGFRFALPELRMLDLGELWPALRDGGLAQIPLTATNAVIATAALISEYWPNRRVTERQLSFNMGIMNLIVPWFGGMPMCHGVGARTGGTNILEGLLEVGLGLFLGSSIAVLFAAFPSAIVGAMMFMVGIELVKFARDLRLSRELVPVAATIAGSLCYNMAVGFIAGIAAHYLIRLISGGDETYPAGA